MYQLRDGSTWCNFFLQAPRSQTKGVQNENCKMQKVKMANPRSPMFLLNLHFSICTLQFAIIASRAVATQGLQHIRPALAGIFHYGQKSPWVILTLVKIYRSISSSISMRRRCLISRLFQT